MENIMKILLAGSSHTRMFYPFVRKYLKGKALVSKLPYDAGNTEEILSSIDDWPLEDKDIIHVYMGHRDLMLNKVGMPFIAPDQFKSNFEKIVDILFDRTAAKIVFSDIPLVSESLLETDAQRNQRIMLYNKIIEDAAGRARVPVHDFGEFVVSHPDNIKTYSDGLHFTRSFYKEFGKHLADFLIRLA